MDRRGVMMNKTAKCESTSYPSHQKKLGPAPFASFEDLSDELESPDGKGDKKEEVVQKLPRIKEDEGEGISGAPKKPSLKKKDSPQNMDKVNTAGCTFSNAGSSGTSSHPFSAPNSALQTPSTPRIDISRASSETPPSGEDSSEKELFEGGLGVAFKEDGTEDLRSSTEDLPLGDDDFGENKKKLKKKKRQTSQDDNDFDLYRRASHPANIFNRKASMPPPTPDSDQSRKPSVHSLYLEGLLSKPTRHSSFGASDLSRPGAVSSFNYPSGSRTRSPSPHKMVLETSFCGSKPIPTKSMEKSSPPKDLPSILPSSTSETISEKTTLATTAQVHSDATRHTEVKRKSENKPITYLHSPGSPKSSDRWRPLSPNLTYFEDFTTKRSSSKMKMVDATQKNSENSSSITPVPSTSTREPEPASQTEKLGEDCAERVKNFRPGKPDGARNYLESNVQKVKEIHAAEPLPQSPLPMRKNMGPKASNDTYQVSKESSGCSKSLQEKPSPAADTAELTNEFKIAEDPMVPVEDVPLETKGLFFKDEDSSYEEEEGELPFVPTTLPQEKTSAIHILSSEERKSINISLSMKPVQRPKSARPPAPASIDDYIIHSQTVPRAKKPGNIDCKMKINLPRDNSIPDSPNKPKSPKRKVSASWSDFAQMGLKSSREIRRQLKEAQSRNAYASNQPEINPTIKYQNSPAGTGMDSSYHSDSSLEDEFNDHPAENMIGGSTSDQDDTEALLKLPSIPFGMDLDVPSNRSSLVSQEGAERRSMLSSSPGSSVDDAKQENDTA